MIPLRTMSTVAGHRKLTTANREHHRSWSSQLHEKLPKNSTMTILRSNSLWSKLKRWKSSISMCLVSWPKIKNLSFWNVIFSYFVQQQRTISRLDCDMQWKVYFIRQPARISSVAGRRRSSKAFPKAKLAPKQCHSHWWSAPVWSTTALWSWRNITCEKYAQQVDEMHRKLQRLQLGCRKDLILLHDNT